MNGKIIFGQYYNIKSPIHSLDPRTKLISLFVLMITVFLMKNIYVLLGMLGIVAIMIIVSKIPLIKFFQSFKMMTMILLFMFAFQIFLTNTGTIIAEQTFNFYTIHIIIILGLLIIYILIGKIYHKHRLLLFLLIAVGVMYLQTQLTTGKLLLTYTVKVYDDGVNSAFKILLRIINLICISSLLTFTTKPTDLNQGLENIAKPLKALKINVSVISMMISIALRFIPTLLNEANRILKAQASRGVDFKEGKLKDKVVQIISLLIPMIVIAYKRAEDLANAMEARGYIPGAERTSINQLAYRKQDVLTFIFTGTILLATICLRIFI